MEMLWTGKNDAIGVSECEQVFSVKLQINSCDEFINQNITCVKYSVSYPFDISKANVTSSIDEMNMLLV